MTRTPDLRRATWETPRYWGEDEADVEVRNGEGVVTQRVVRQGRRFANIVVATPSGQTRFRISHVTLDGGAIDAVLRGALPPDVAREFPRVSGVVRNAVFEETLEAIRIFDRAGEARENGFEGSRLQTDEDAGGAAHVEISTAYAEQMRTWTQGAGAGLKWPESLDATILLDYREGILGCAPDQPLGRDYRLMLARQDRSFEYGAGYARPSADADQALRQLGVRAARRGRSLAYSLYTLVDHNFLREMPIDAVDLPHGGLLSGDSDRFGFLAADREQRDRARRIVAYLVARRMPAGIDVAELRLFHDTRFCGDVFGGVRLTIPGPKLRISIIENVSREDIPIEGIVQGFVERDDIVAWSPGAQPTSTFSVPWAGASSGPGRQSLCRGVFTLTACRRPRK